ncbi:unnamed protein product [Calypogeia fissa]
MEGVHGTESMWSLYPVVMNLLIPLVMAVTAWAVLPVLLRRIHGYVEQGSATILHAGTGKSHESCTPYELSLWAALEEPCRLFATFLFLSQLWVIVAPTTFASRYLNRIWNAGSVGSLIWFLHRWKRNLMTRFLKDKKMTMNERDRYMALDQVTSLILLFIGALGLAEASGVAVQSLLTVGGIGGVATAFAARDVLGNMLSGVSLVFSKPFIVGDFIRAGNVEGKVEEVGIHSTRLLNGAKCPVVVPNSFFSSEVIVNLTRAPWRALSLKVPIRLQDFEKVEKITSEVRSFLNNHPKVYLGEDEPRCSASQLGATAIEIIITTNIKPMSNEEYFPTEQEILVRTARIVTDCSAVLGGML